MADVLAILDVILYGLIAFVIVGFIGAMIIIFALRGKYKHYFFRLDLTSGKAIGHLDRAKIFKETDGTVFWQLQQAKHKINRPPNQAIIPLDNGRYFVRAFDLGNMNYKYSSEELDDKILDKIKEVEQKVISDNTKSFFNKIKEHLLDMRRDNFLRHLVAKPTPIVVYTAETFTQEFTKETSKDLINADERQNVFNQIKKAYEKKAKGWAVWGIPVVVIVSLVILVSVMFIFGENLVKPIANMQSVNAEIAKTNQGTQERLSEIMRYITIIVEDKQIAQGEAGGSVLLLNRTAPN